MRTSRVDVVRHGGATSGTRAGTTAVRERAGLLLRLETPDGFVSQGEASPLPGYSPESLDDAGAALSGLDWAHIPEPSVADSFGGGLSRIATVMTGAPPSARFAVETAWLDLLGQRAKRPLWALLRGTTETPTSVPLCAYVGSAEEDSVVDAAERAAKRGMHTVKVKIAGPPTAAVLDRLRRVRDVIGGRRLRLDANRSFAADTCSDTLSRLAELSPELLEEPLPVPALTGLGSSPVPLALDESLQDPTTWDAVSPHFRRLRIEALVLKPMALGGFSVCLELAKRASAAGLDVTVSHLFDGPVALLASTHLALAVASRSRGSGLDRHAGLAAWSGAHSAAVDATTLVATDAAGLGMSGAAGVA